MTDDSIEAAFLAYEDAGPDLKPERAEEFLRRPGAPEWVLDQLRRLTGGNRDRYWAVVIDQAKSSVDHRNRKWQETVVGWLHAGNAEWQESAHVCTEASLYAYEVGLALPLNEREVRDGDATAPAGRARLHLHIAALRLTYRWVELAECFEKLRTPPDELDAFARAYYVFGLIINGHDDAERETKRLLDKAPDNRRVHMALLEALRLSHSLPADEQGKRMLELLERDALRGWESPDPLYRKAFALRRLGRYPEAQQAVDDCLARLPIGRADRDRTRILQEHDLIMAERAIKDQREAAEEAAEKSLKEHAERLRGIVDDFTESTEKSVSDALFRSVEVLGLFIAIIALLAASLGSAAATDLLWWQRAALIGLSAVMVLLFFFSLRGIVRPRRPRKRR